MARKVNQALWDQWQRRIERQRNSGLSIADYCRREGVSQASFHAWKRKLGSSSSRRQPWSPIPAQRPSEASKRIVPRRPRSRSSRSACATPVGAPSFLQLPVLGTRSSPWIELTLADGTIIRIPQQNVAALQVVLRALRNGDVDATGGEISHA